MYKIISDQLIRVSQRYVQAHSSTNRFESFFENPSRTIPF